jgi:quinol monooxygenase YgiN
MYVLHVQIQVKPEAIEAFKAATRANAAATVGEPGARRFDVIQQLDDPTRFVLAEAYLAAEDHASHRLTPHYATWIEAVAPMMAEPRTALKYSVVFPDESGW